jgi:hypothetical protein
MPIFTDLTPAQQAQVLSFMPIFRTTMGLIAQALNRLSQLDSAWVAAISTSVTSLDAGATIPDQTAMSGAAELTREDIIGLMLAAETVLTGNNAPANRAEYIKVAGLQGTMG